MMRFGGGDFTVERSASLHFQGKDLSTGLPTGCRTHPAAFYYSSVECLQAGTQPSHHTAPQTVQVLNLPSLSASPQVPQCVCSNTKSSAVNKTFFLSIRYLACDVSTLQKCGSTHFLVGLTSPCYAGYRESKNCQGLFLPSHHINRGVYRVTWRVTWGKSLIGKDYGEHVAHYDGRARGDIVLLRHLRESFLRFLNFDFGVSISAIAATARRGV